MQQVQDKQGMRPRQHKAGRPGPDRGGEWCHIQLAASHKGVLFTSGSSGLSIWAGSV